MFLICAAFILVITYAVYKKFSNENKKILSITKNFASPPRGLFGMTEFYENIFPNFFKDGFRVDTYSNYHFITIFTRNKLLAVLTIVNFKYFEIH